MAHDHTKTTNSEFIDFIDSMITKRKAEVFENFRELCDTFNEGVALKDSLEAHIYNLSTLPAIGNDGLYERWHSEATERYEALSEQLETMRIELDIMRAEYSALCQITPRGTK